MFSNYEKSIMHSKSYNISKNIMIGIEIDEIIKGIYQVSSRHHVHIAADIHRFPNSRKKHTKKLQSILKIARIIVFNTL